MKFLNEFTPQHGYSLMAKNSKKRKADGILHCVYLQCNCGGQYQSWIDENSRIQNRQTKLSGCPFRLVLRLGDDEEWHLDLSESQHNHEPSPPSTHPTLHQEEVEARSQEIEAQINIGLNTGKIVSTIHKHDVSSSIKSQDIYKKRQKCIMSSLMGEPLSRHCSVLSQKMETGVSFIKQMRLII